MKVGARGRGREELGEGGWGGEEEGKGALCCGAVPSWISFQDGHTKGQGTELAPPSGILSRDLSRLPTSLLPSTGSHTAPSPYEARNKEWLLISWNTWDHRGVGKGRGKLKIFCGLGEGGVQRAPQLPMYLSLPGRILANAGKGFWDSVQLKSQPGMLQVLLTDPHYYVEISACERSKYNLLFGHLQDTLNEYLIWSHHLPNH